MTKQELITAVKAVKIETQNALQTMYNMLDEAQKKQIVNDEDVKVLFDRYGVNY